MMFAMTTLLVALVAAPPADVKGKWEGKIIAQRDDGTTSEDTALLILDQKDGKITGTGGGSESDQHPVTSGTIDGNKVSLVVTHAKNGREFKLELTVDGDQMKGTLMSGERRADLVLTRRKQ